MTSYLLFYRHFKTSFINKIAHPVINSRTIANYGSLKGYLINLGNLCISSHTKKFEAKS